MPSKASSMWLPSAVAFVPPFAIPSVPVMSLVRETEAQVATPEPLRERTN